MKDRLYKISLVLVLIPLILGTGIYFLWLKTRWNALKDAGLLTIIGGVICVIISISCLIRLNLSMKRKGLRVALKENLLVVSLSILDFIAAYFICRHGLQILLKQYSVQ